MGEGALRGLPPPSTMRVAERLGLVPRGETAGNLAPLSVGLTAVLGGVAGRGGDGTRPVRFGGCIPGAACEITAHYSVDNNFAHLRNCIAKRKPSQNTCASVVLGIGHRG